MKSTLLSTLRKRSQSMEDSSGQVTLGCSLKSSPIVVFQRRTHPLQINVQLAQLFWGYKAWHYVHCILYYPVGYNWVRIELGWDGITMEDYEPWSVVEEAEPITVVSVTSDDESFDRLLHVMIMRNSLRDNMRYCPWSSIPHLFGKPSWFNCTSIVSYILFGTLIYEPAKLYEILGGINE